MLPAFAVAEQIGNEDIAADTGPRHAHVLKLALRLRIVMRRHDDDPRRSGRQRIGPVEFRRHPLPGPAFVDDVVDLETVAYQRARHVNRDGCRKRREGAERRLQLRDPGRHEVFPRFLRVDLAPLEDVVMIDAILFLRKPAADLPTRFLGGVAARLVNVGMGPGRLDQGVARLREEKTRGEGKCVHGSSGGGTGGSSGEAPIGPRGCSRFQSICRASPCRIFVSPTERFARPSIWRIACMSGSAFSP